VLHRQSHRTDAASDLLELGWPSSNDTRDETDVQRSGLTHGTSASVMDSSGHLVTPSWDVAATESAATSKDLPAHSVSAETSPLEVQPVV